jgi:hypothetical protein
MFSTAPPSVTELLSHNYTVCLGKFNHCNFVQLTPIPLLSYAPSMQPPQRMHIASVMKQCSGYELAVIVMNLLYTLPLTSLHNNKDVHKGATH